MEEWTEPKQLSDGSKGHQICESGSAMLLHQFPLAHPLPCLSPSSAHARGMQKCPHGISGREQPKSGGISPSLGNTSHPISHWVHPHLTSRTEDESNPCPASPPPCPRAQGPDSHRSSHGVNGAGHLPQPKCSVPWHNAPRTLGGRIRPSVSHPRSQTSQEGARFPLFSSHHQ